MYDRAVFTTWIALFIFGSVIFRPTTSAGNQKTIHVVTDTINNDIAFKQLEKSKHYEYVFTTDPGSKLLAACNLKHISWQIPDKCEGLTLTLESNKREIQKYCETKEDIFFHSEDVELKIVLNTGPPINYGSLDCTIRSVIAGTYSNYKEIASEEVDSSEHGLITKPGTKMTTCNCGWANKDHRRIIFGEDAGPHEYPWTVSLQSFGYHFCGGSIISEYHIITAAHCVKQLFGPVYAIIGTNRIDDKTNSIEVKEVILHEYDDTNVQKDIALLVLKNKIEFNQQIGPVCLPSKQPDIEYKYVTAMGWGELGRGEYKHKNPDLLKKTKLRVIDIYSCTQDWNFLWNVQTARVICTWSNHTDICMGDSGGPVVWLDPETNRYTLVGMPALSDGCRLRKPSAHTSVYHFYDWIQTKIAGSKEPTATICTRVD